MRRSIGSVFPPIPLMTQATQEPKALAPLMLAALAAPGESRIHGAHHVRRGYATIEEKFRGLGAELTHVSEEEKSPA